MSSVSKKTIQEYWTKNVPGWDIFYKKYSPDKKDFYIEVDKFRYKYDSYIIPIIDSFAGEGNLVLEVGCGLGSDSRYIAKRGSNIISLDLSPRNVYFTEKGMQLLGLKGRGICADAEKLPFQDNSFDVVYSFGVLHHSPGTQMAINEIHRVLKPKGRCTVMLYHRGYAYYLLLLLYGYRQLLGVYDKDRLTSRYDNTPLSKMFSKKDIYKLFSKFRDLDVKVTTYGGIQAHPLLIYIYKILHANKFLMRNFGSYLIINGKK